MYNERQDGYIWRRQREIGMAAIRRKRKQGSCEQCNNYVYDDDYECYVCEVDLDEDEMARFLADECRDCPYYQPGDEYLVVRRQM